MISTLITAPAAPALDWDLQVKGHLRVDADDEEVRANTVLIPAASEWVEGVTGRQLITATWSFWWPSFDAACAEAAKYCKFPSDTILIPKPPLSSVTWVKYYDASNVQQTWASTNYVVVAPAGPKCGPGWLRPVPTATFPTTYERPDAVELKAVCGYGATYASVPGGLAAAMLLLVGEQFERREEAIAGTIINTVPLAAINLAQGYQVQV